jgi:hypothetical protein
VNAGGEGLEWGFPVENETNLGAKMPAHPSDPLDGRRYVEKAVGFLIGISSIDKLEDAC